MGRQIISALIPIFAALAAGCGGGEVSSGASGSAGSTTASAGSAGTAGSAGSSAGSNTGGTTTTTTTMVTSATVGGAAGSGGMFNCDPPADPDSLFAQSDTGLDENVVSMCKYRGDVLLIVNVAEA